MEPKCLMTDSLQSPSVMGSTLKNNTRAFAVEKAEQCPKSTRGKLIHSVTLGKTDGVKVYISFIRPSALLPLSLVSFQKVEPSFVPQIS